MIYLDHAATTVPYPEVVDTVRETATEMFGNPSSLHHYGVAAEGVVRVSSETLARLMKCKPSEIIYTSGGTESDNLALMGVARSYKRNGRHLVTTAIEHPAVLETMRALEREGFEVTYLPVDEMGRVRLDALKAALKPETILVSMMHTNNEVGTMQPIAEAAAIVHKACPEALFHTDAVQAFGKVPIQPAKLGIDLMSASAHKFHGPRGTGFLYVRSGVRLQPLMYGGGQQGGLRSGTEDVPGICGMAIAAKIAYESEHAFEHMTAPEHGEHTFCYTPVSVLRDFLVSNISSNISDITVNGDSDRILSLTVKGVRGEVLLHALEQKQIYVSTGSACSSHAKHTGSETLTAMGLDSKAQDETIRISLDESNTLEEMEIFCEELASTVEVLRRYV